MGNKELQGTLSQTDLMRVAAEQWQQLGKAGKAQWCKEHDCPEPKPKRVPKFKLVPIGLCDQKK
jgi:hypothetical protein